MVVSRNVERQYWLWVTRPEYYLDADGNEREDLDPSRGEDTEGWWTCHKETRRGDLIFLWRTTPKKDIGYLIQAKSDAYSITDDEFAAKQGWDYGCDYQVLYRFSPPLTIQALKNDPTLHDWSPLLQQFRRRVFRIAPEYWAKLNRLIANMQPPYRAFTERLEKEPIFHRILLEEQLEDTLVRQLSLLKPFGYHLELYRDPNTGVSGRQFVCKGHGGRIDLLCYDVQHGRYVVIELKNVRAAQNTFAQICSYVGWVQKRIAHGTPVIGLAISRGYDARFESSMEVTDRIFHLDLTQLGFD